MAGSNTLRAVLKKLDWSRTRLVAELRRQAASSGDTLPGTESVIAMVSRWANNHQQRAQRNITGPAERELRIVTRPGA